MKLTGPPPHDAVMDRHLIATLAVIVVAPALLVAAARGCAPARSGAVAVASASAGGASAPQPASPDGAASDVGITASPDGPAQLDAVRTVKLFCDLVDGRRLWAAAGLFASPRVWTRTQLRAVRGLSFQSGRAYTAPDAHTVVVAATVRATTRAGSPVLAGTGTLFFTLGRVGTTSGGWLITAVTASPQPPGKGSP